MSPVQPKRPRLLVEPPSTNWFDLPLEMQEMVIDRMDPKTRCEFAKCSKWCEYEAKKSNNYLNMIGLAESKANNYALQVLLGHTKTLEKKYEGDYWLEFVHTGENQTIVSYKCGTDLEKVVKWTKLESGEPKDVRLKYFNEYVEKYKHSIRHFFLNHCKTSVTDLSIKNLENLNEVTIFDLPRDFRNRSANLVECGLFEMKQLIRLKSLLCLRLNLTFEQIIELKGETIRVRSEDFNEAKTNKYLKMIKKGEIHENSKSIYIFFDEENTIENVQDVMRGLDIFDYSEKGRMSSALPKRPRLLDEPPSIGWFDLPLEMREMVIDRMDPKTRCRFAQCSKWCEYEAKKSKNYLYKIGLTENMGNGNALQLCISHTNKDANDYFFEFADAGENQTNVSYKCDTDLKEVVKWTKLESGEPMDIRLKYLNDYMEKYKHSITEFYSRGIKTSVTDFSIKLLKNLEHLQVMALYFQDYTNGRVNLVECGLIEMKQLIRLKSLYCLPLNLTFEQIVELKCESIDVRSTDFSETNINKYLKMIKKGEIHENASFISIGFDGGSTIENVQNVMAGLDIFGYSEKESMSSVLPKRRRLLDQSTSTNWFDLPLEMRQMVIDEMDPKTRCQFAQCSKWCEYEAKKSKNYLNMIGLAEIGANNCALQLLMGHTKEFRGDYLLEFVDGGENQTIVSYKCDTDSETFVKWTKLESGKPKDVRWKYFNEYVEKYNRSIRHFYSNQCKTSVIDLNIRNLENLKKITIFDNSIRDNRNSSANFVDCGFIKMKQLIPLIDLIAPDWKLTFEQIAKLNAENIRVTPEDFSEENVNKHLKMIKKGEIHENARCINFSIPPGSTINVRNITNGLNISNYFEEHDRFTTSYSFNFMSDVKKNGMFHVNWTPQLCSFLTLQLYFQIQWNETPESD